MKRVPLCLLLLVALFTVSAGDSKPKTQHHASGKSAASEQAEALQKLIAGNRRFVAHRMQRPNDSIARRVDLAKNGQRPFAIILSCSDSRVPPEVVFDKGLGDLFVVRVAGNVANDAVIGSIEYAAEHLGAKLVLVLGHESCGAVSAAIANNREAHVAALVDAIKPAVDKVNASQPEARKPSQAEHTAQVVKANVELVASQLKASDPVLAKMVREGELKIVGGYYNLKSGRVDLLQ
ncbi:MAG TPA: carbonic anhydrase [Blastocatellia bacterium]|nr:carbonic anhydrase [Blastocatellia bacterium]